MMSISAPTSTPPVSEKFAFNTLAVMFAHPVTTPLAAHRSKLSSRKPTGSKSSALAGAPLGVRNGIAAGGGGVRVGDIGPFARGLACTTCHGPQRTRPYGDIALPAPRVKGMW